VEEARSYPREKRLKAIGHNAAGLPAAPAPRAWLARGERKDDRRRCAHRPGMCWIETFPTL